MKFQFNQANQAIVSIHDCLVVTFWEAMTSDFKNTAHCGFCCHAAPFFPAKKWLNSSISSCQFCGFTAPGFQTLTRIYLDSDSHREIFL